MYGGQGENVKPSEHYSFSRVRQYNMAHVFDIFFCSIEENFFLESELIFRLL